MFGHEKILEEIKELNEYGIYLIIIDLLSSGKLDPDKFNTWCIKYLSEKEMTRQGKFNKMAIMLGMVCSDPSAENRLEAMKYMYDNKFHEGSKFGDKLKEQFDNKND